MDEEIERLVVSVRADTSAFARGSGFAMRRNRYSWTIRNAWSRLRSSRGMRIHNITRFIAAIIIATAFVLLFLNIAGLYQFGQH